MTLPPGARHGANAIGDSQLKRYLLVASSHDSLPGLQVGLRRPLILRDAIVDDERAVLRSPTKSSSGSSGSGMPHVPSPPTVTIQCLFWIPDGSSEFDGPHQPLLSCKPAQTVYGLSVPSPTR